MSIRIPARILVIASAFPVYSETFIIDHIRGLLASSAEVALMARKLTHETYPSDVEDISNALTIATECRRSVSRLGRMLHLMRGVVHIGIRPALHPLGRSAIYCAKSSRDLQRSFSPSLVHSHFGPNGLMAISRSRTPVPIVTDFHGYDALSVPRRYGWGVYRPLRARATVVAHSLFMQGIISDGLGTEVHYVPYGIDFDMYRPRPRLREWAPPLNLLVVGRLVPQKGIDVALRALAILRSASPEWDANLTIVGGGPLEESLKQVAYDMGLEGAVTFRGVLTPLLVAEAMRQADMLLAPSRPLETGWVEAFGRVAIEAQCAGLPVIASSVGGLPEALGEGCISVPYDNEQAIVGAILELVEKGDPQSLQASGWRKASQYSLNNMMAAYLRIYELSGAVMER